VVLSESDKREIKKIIAEAPCPPALALRHIQREIKDVERDVSKLQRKVEHLWRLR